jgi:phenylalanyl-tRNA synthetase beta chain
LLSPFLPDRLGLADEHPWRHVIRLANPLSQEESVLRPSLLPGLLLAAERNATRRVRSIRLFEIGATFEPAWHDDARGGRLPKERLRVALVLAGEAPEGWLGERWFDVYDAKGLLDRLAASLGLRLEYAAASLDVLHPGRGARVVFGDREVGYAGELHPRLARILDLIGRVAVAEIDLEPLVGAPSEEAPGHVPRFPAAERDLAVVIPDTVAAADVAAIVSSAAGPLLEAAALFDVYRGEQAGPGNVSLAFRLSFRHAERTLTDEEIGEAMTRIVGALRECGWRPRE